MKKILYLFISMLLFIAVACEQTIENEDSIIPASNLSASWSVNAFIDNNLIFGPFQISTQMTSNNDSIYIKDNGSFWMFQAKAELDESKNGFKTNLSVNVISSLGAKVKVANGSIINNDSIVFDIQFEDDETAYGYTYKIMGQRM